MNVYDFDNTLYDGESGVQMFFFYLKKRPWLVCYAPFVLRGLIDYKRHKVNIDQVVEKYGWIFQAFIKGIEDFPRDAREFWDRHEHRICSFYKDLQRPDDLIISASPEPSLREVCARLGVKHYIGTVVNENTHTFDFVCFRENKVKAFRERYPGQQIDDFYTDSMNDKPLMDISRRVFLVKKGIITQIKGESSGAEHNLSYSL